MSKKWKETKKTLKHSPTIFDDEEIGTSSSDEVKILKLSVTPTSKYSTNHSTPIQSKSKTDSSDSPDLNYIDSPIEPLTQNPPNEVGWDYQRPVVKEENGKNTFSMDISKTPKRNTLLPKKRNSNSPLLYKPLKKKLIQEEQKEHMAGFMAELKAIKINSTKYEKKHNPQKMENKIESQLIFELDSQPSDDSDIKLQVSANTDESPIKKQSTTVNQNCDGLLDDSIEDMMVLCSQEVEAKEFGEKKRSSTISPDSVRLKEKLKNSLNECRQFMIGNKKNIDDLKTKNVSVFKTESGSLEIPDDSFDDFFVEIDDNDLCKNLKTEVVFDCENRIFKTSNSSSIIPEAKSISSSKLSIPQNKFFQSKSSSCIMQSNSNTISNCNYNNYLETSKTLIQNKIVNTKANFGYLNKDYMKNSSGFSSQSQANISSISNKNSETRLFKTKSYSDSNFLQERNAINTFGQIRNNYNFKVDSISEQKQPCNFYNNQNSQSSYYASESSTENKTWRRVNSSSSIGRFGIGNNSQQSSLNALSSNGGSQSLSTPAEIEKKRQEAIMKREAKIKMRNKILNRPIRNAVTR